MDLKNLSISQIFDLFSKKKLTSVQLIEYYLDAIEKLNDEYNVFLFIKDRKELIEQAKEADAERESGSNKKLLGIPYCLKDSFMALGTITTAGDKFLEGAKSEYSASIVDMLESDGAILIGKVNMDSWGFGSTTENSAYGVTKNLFNTRHVAGGSSGGSAAAVALNMCAFSIGEDTGGSIRTPASFCGVYGFKPTYGRISRFGCIAYASSLDTVGAMARSAEDLNLVFSVINGVDGKDQTIEIVPENHLAQISQVLKRFAYSNDFILEGIDEDVKKAYLETIEKLKQIGYKAVEVSFKSIKYAVPTYYVTAMSEASTNLARYQGTRYGSAYNKIEINDPFVDDVNTWEALFIKSRSEGFTAEAKRRIFMGSYVLSEGFHDAYYEKAVQARSLLSNEINEILEDNDFILSPVAPTPAPKIGELSGDPIKAYLEDIFTVTANLTGIPAVAFPVTISKNSLPIGMQIMGKKFDDEKLFRIVEEITK